MEEKIKISLSKTCYQILMKDTENFEFYKKDGSLNRNAFLNTLIENYCDAYAAQQKNTLQLLSKRVSALHGVRLKEVGEVCNEILNDLNRSQLENGEKLEVSLSFRPTKESAYSVEYIRDCLSVGTTVSNYFRMMLLSYSQQPQDAREKIIFRKQYETIARAIEEHKQIYFTIRGNSARQVSPYAVVSSKEELYNYMLSESTDGTVHTNRLTRITNVSILNEDAHISQEALPIFEKMQWLGPQYNFLPKENYSIVVKLTANGQRMFKVMYLHRPIPVSIEEDRYLFDCSEEQVFQYFCRFGEAAYIVKPKRLRERIKSFYDRGSELYRDDNPVKK
ncbi:MAG: WYL domain-containing protein [Solobacterium sp.]|jgi:hypothetical protein|nr:WYL domain-containing protein [Solobacterium sp.]MCH4221931.1 WYL domain-containing protein [Solobacterium sp.]MCH4265245.1 WYL domain-containing protein [Solobacterium sp.]